MVFNPNFRCPRPCHPYTSPFFWPKLVFERQKKRSILKLLSYLCNKVTSQKMDAALYFRALRKEASLRLRCRRYPRLCPLPRHRPSTPAKRVPSDLLPKPPKNFPPKHPKNLPNLPQSALQRRLPRHPPSRRKKRLAEGIKKKCFRKGRRK